MKNAVTVRKPRSHRVFICIFSALMMAAITVVVFLFHTASAIIFYIPPLIIAAPLTLYYMTWQIRFGKDRIEKKVFYRTKSYSYAELQEVAKGYYISEKGYCIRMRFTDGKTMRFRMEDENADKALKQLQRHCSIKLSSNQP